MFILLLFPFFGSWLYAQMEKPTSIIMIMAGGMGVSEISAALVKNNDTLNLERFSKIGFIKNYKQHNFAIDLKYGTLPIAWGKHSYMDNPPDSVMRSFQTIFDIAHEKGKLTGIITSGELVSNSISPFYSHRPFHKNTDKIVWDLIDANPEVMIGGGKRYFKDPDGKDFYPELEIRDYKIIEDIKTLKKRTARKVAAIMDKSNMPAAEKRGNFFEQAWLRAFKSLVKNDKGFFLVIENPHIEWAARQNDSRYMTSEIIDYDKLIGKILSFLEADPKTLILVVCPYEIGGFSLNDGDLNEKHINPKWSSRSTTACLVPVFATGNGADLFTSIYSNEEIFTKLKSLME